MIGNNTGLRALPTRGHFRGICKGCFAIKYKSPHVDRKNLESVRTILVFIGPTRAYENSVYFQHIWKDNKYTRLKKL